jgi:hypothetical protein
MHFRLYCNIYVFGFQKSNSEKSSKLDCVIRVSYRPSLLNDSISCYDTVRLATSWTVLGSNPTVDKIFPTFHELPCGPPSLLYDGYQIILRG